MNEWEFGGFFSFYENKGREYHNNVLKLNSARYCLEYLLKEKKYKKIYLPYYICDSVVNTIKKLGIEIEYYNIDKNMRPILLIEKIEKNEVIFLVNYFGFIAEKEIKSYKEKYENIILDNTQAFFFKSLKNIDTIYSCRKFFPVVEGGYLYSEGISEIEYQKLEQVYIYDKLEFLFKRYEKDANSAYSLYQEIESKLDKIGIKKISNLTINLLKGIDYNFSKVTRERNFLYLHNKLKNINQLEINEKNINGPFSYPLLIEKNIKQDLLKERIYIPTLWQEVKTRVEENSFEYNLVENLHSIPIDERWNIEDLEKVISKILKNI